jgi:hypothetical protein
VVFVSSYPTVVIHCWCPACVLNLGLEMLHYCVLFRYSLFEQVKEVFGFISKESPRPTEEGKQHYFVRSYRTLKMEVVCFTETSTEGTTATLCRNTKTVSKLHQSLKEFKLGDILMHLLQIFWKQVFGEREINKTGDVCMYNVTLRRVRESLFP